jgi:hypothetical protein
LDLTKLLIFLAVFVGFLIVARLLSSGDQSYPIQSDLRPVGEQHSGSMQQPVSYTTVTGAEVPFPVEVPPIEYLGEGKYSRPILRNYYFTKIDLVRGPENPTAFFDELRLRLEHPDTGYQWTMHYIIATPSGIDALLQSENLDSLLLNGKVLLVSRWNLAQILKDVMDDVIAEQQMANSAADEEEQQDRPNYKA